VHAGSFRIELTFVWIFGRTIRIFEPRMFPSTGGRLGTSAQLAENLFVLAAWCSAW
jgi:hypothetical protein